MMKKIGFMLMIAVLGMGFQFAWAAPATTYQLIIRLGGIEASDLETVRSIIEQRFIEAEIEGVEVVITPDDLIEIQIRDSFQNLLVGQNDFLKIATTRGQLEFVELPLETVPVEEGNCLLTTAENPILTCPPLERGLEDRPALPDEDGSPYFSVVAGEVIEDAAATPVETGSDNWWVNFTLAEEASTIFADYTGSHIGTRLAIVVDGVVISAPTINDRIEGSGVIQGNFDRAEAENLAAILRAGALNATLEIVEISIMPE